MKQKAMYFMIFAATAAALFAADTPLRASEADDRIEAAFKKGYVYRTYLKDDAIKIVAKNGVVMLTGTVTSESRKTLAQAAVASLSGVTRVNNQLVISGETAAENMDGYVCQKVLFALRLHRNVIAGKTFVAVNHGVVTLSGEAANEAQKELTADYAADIEGVKKVQNLMTVATIPAPPDQTAYETLDDASVTAQIVTLLLTHRSTSTIIPRVTTRSGAVTVTGIAESAAQKDLVTRRIADVRGVTGVSNEMTVVNQPDK